MTVFAVHGSRLTRIRTIASGGRFPVSVAVHGDRVYVLNALDGGSLQGYRILGAHLVSLPGQHRALGLDPHAVPQFTHTPAQVEFTPDNRLSGLAAEATVTSTGAGSVPFGFAFSRDGRLLLTEAGPNALVAARLDRTGDRLGPGGHRAASVLLDCGRGRLRLRRQRRQRNHHHLRGGPRQARRDRPDGRRGRRDRPGRVR